MLLQERPKNVVMPVMECNATGEAVYLDFAAAIIRYGKEKAHVKGLNENDDALVKNLGKKL